VLEFSVGDFKNCSGYTVFGVAGELDDGMVRFSTGGYDLLIFNLHHGLLKPNEVARQVAFLASAESGLMTGSIIDFDQQVLGAGDAPAAPPALD